jgi:hypothetical protein
MLFALPCYPFPYIVIYRCFYLVVFLPYTNQEICTDSEFFEVGGHIEQCVGRLVTADVGTKWKWFHSFPAIHCFRSLLPMWAKNRFCPSLHTGAKSRDQEIVSAQKKVSKGRPNTPRKSCNVVMDPQVLCEVICDQALNQMLFQ